MKLLTLAIFVMSCQFTMAQTGRGGGLVISLSGGVFFPCRQARNVVESFSYTSTAAATGVTTNQYFTGALGADFPKGTLVGDIMNFEVTSEHHAINGGFGLFEDVGANDGGYLKTGYRWVLLFHRKRFQFKPGADLYGILGSEMKMGSIDNKGKIIQLLGFTAQPQWTTSYTSRSGNTTYTTHESDHVNILYRRNGLVVEPKVVVSTSLGRLTLGLESGWMFQLAQGCAILLKQADAGDGDWNTIGKIHQPHNGSLTGFYGALQVGIIYRRRKGHDLF